MKLVPQDMLDLIVTQRRFAIAELYTFTLNDGATDYFTGLDQDLILLGHVFKSNSLRIEGLRYNVGVGFRVDEQDLKISAYPGEELAGADFFGAIQQGLLDGALVKRQRGFWAANQGASYRDYIEPPVAVVDLFTGFVSNIERLGRTFAQIKVKSPLSRLDIDLPRNSYQAGCLWTLYDEGCTVNRADFTTSYTVSAVTAQNIVPLETLTPVTGADGVPYYALGRLKFTSGVLNNFQTFVESNSGSDFGLAYPLKVLPDVGDTFEVSAGCTKIGRGGACELKFGNMPNFRAFSRVPPIVVSI